MKKFAVKVFSNVYQNYVLPNLEIKQFFDEKFQNGEVDKEAVQETESFINWEQQSYNVTVGDYLLKAFPNLFEWDFESEQAVCRKKMQIISHGMIIDLNTPMYWLQLNLSYLDNFVYLSFHQPSE